MGRCGSIQQKLGFRDALKDRSRERMNRFDRYNHPRRSDGWSGRRKEEGERRGKAKNARGGDYRKSSHGGTRKKVHYVMVYHYISVKWEGTSVLSAQPSRQLKSRGKALTPLGATGLL